MIKPFINQHRTLNDTGFIHINAGHINGINTLTTRIPKVNGNINIVVFDTQNQTFKVVTTSHHFSNLEYIGSVEVDSNGKTVSFPNFDFSHNHKQLLETLPSLEVLDRITKFVNGKLYYCQAENILAIGIGEKNYKIINSKDTLYQSLLLRYRGNWDEEKIPSRIYRGDIFNIKDGIILGSVIKPNTLVVANTSNPIAIGDFNEILNITTSDTSATPTKIIVECKNENEKWSLEKDLEDSTKVIEFTIPYNMFLPSELDTAFDKWICEETSQEFSPGEKVTINSNLILIPKWKSVALNPVEFTIANENITTTIGNIKEVAIENPNNAIISIQSLNENATATYNNGKVTITPVRNGDINIKVIGTLEGYTETVKYITGIITLTAVEFNLSNTELNLELDSNTIVMVTDLTTDAVITIDNKNSNTDVIITDNNINITAKKVGNININVIGAKSGMLETIKTITGNITTKTEGLDFWQG